MSFKRISGIIGAQKVYTTLIVSQNKTFRERRQSQSLQQFCLIAS